MCTHTNRRRIRHDRGDGARLAGGPLFPVLMSTGSVGRVQRRQRTLVWVKSRPSPLLALFS